jgi:hypothetical protein
MGDLFLPIIVLEILRDMPRVSLDALILGGGALLVGALLLFAYVLDKQMRRR